MIAYATPAQLDARLGDLYADVYTDKVGAKRVDWQQEDLESASAEIDAKIAVHYVVPVASATAQILLRNWTLTLAEELAWVRSGGGAQPEALTTRCQIVRRDLDSVGKGEMRIPGAASRPPLNVAAAATPIFTRDKLSRFGGA